MSGTVPGARYRGVIRSGKSSQSTWKFLYETEGGKESWETFPPQSVCPLHRPNVFSKILFHYSVILGEKVFVSAVATATLLMC